MTKAEAKLLENLAYYQGLHAGLQQARDLAANGSSIEAQIYFAQNLVHEAIAALVRFRAARKKGK